MATSTTQPETTTNETVTTPPRKPRLWGRSMIIIRRTHLYAGLFLLPWVLLYGVTGAMFNHQELFPNGQFESLDASLLADSPMTDFPTPAALAEQVVTELQAASPRVTIELADNHGAEFTGDVMFEVKERGTQHIVKIDPISHHSQLVIRPENPHQPQNVPDVARNIQLNPDPHDAAQQSAGLLLTQTGIETQHLPKPLGWTKLNFLAHVDGEAARITYVLKDGHIDATQYDGHHGMGLRQLFLRLHTTHGQSPHWNGRVFWTFAVDAMAIAMVVWGFSGILMWWQIKRTRLIGSLVIGASILTAVAMYVSMFDFYATTKL
ncbi:MAG: PepSY domain-containing protein [Planctomycetaceae bacterium]|nr:PepSY domain-containing protein [Planctomycetaceae bacterium]